MNYFRMLYFLGDELEIFVLMFIFKVYFKIRVIENIFLYGKFNENVFILE